MENISYQFDDKVTPEYIYKRVAQEKLYEKYLGIQPELGKLYCNPLRKDSTPTCSFFYTDSQKLVFRDWSYHLHMDIFDVVQKRYDVNFYQALNIVASDFDLLNQKTPDPVAGLPMRPVKKQKKIFNVRVQPLTRGNLHYLSLYGITPEIAKKFNVFGVKQVYIYGKGVYNYSDYNPAIGYYFGLNSQGHQKWKIYQYMNYTLRFIGNTSRINGLIQLPEKGDIVVITKSMKDVMTLYRLGLPAVATQGESILPNQELITDLKQRFTHVVSMYDFDSAGIRSAAHLRREYDIAPYMLTDGRAGSKDYKSKDISDYVKDHGVEAAQKLVNYALETIFYETPTNSNDSQLSIAI